MTRVSGNNRDSDRKVFTDEVTRLLGAMFLCQSRFPAPDCLPRVSPVPYRHLGQLVLVDYAQLAAILWGTVAEIQTRLRKNLRFKVAPIAGVMVAAAVATLLFFFIQFWSLLIGAVAGLIVFGMILPNVPKIVADIRAKNARLLLDGGVPECAHSWWNQQRGKTIGFGDGQLGTEKVPVLVVTHDHQPFPGFGRHQARQLFVCRPSDQKPPSTEGPSGLSESVSHALYGLVYETGISTVTYGHVVVVHGESLRKGSPWLDKAGRPLPYIDAEGVGHVESKDPDASARAYTALQVLVPEYMMCATFFVRTFLAGNSAACEVCVSTLGPPIVGWQYVRERLALHERETAGSGGSAAPERRITKNDLEADSGLVGRLRAIRFLFESRGDTFMGGHGRAAIDSFRPFNADESRALEEEAREIARHSEMWPGVYLDVPNWREDNSVTFTDDFFGNAESRAIVRTIYDRVCRAVLKTLEELGFDVSDYQDDSGKLSINAEKIEQMVVGEKIVMKKKRGADTETVAAGTAK